jgi:hypothetical protein
MNSPERADNTSLVAGVVLLFGGTLALVTGHASWRGHEIEPSLATPAGVIFIVLGGVFLSLYVRNRMRNR